ncbi:conserved hypothetical protein [Culex quinquefasciatus]|uniref:F-box domain-containing protein n=1 Tax=Culex quinquefasciatus TaxID=7176 RepID=B0W4F4_CULQU|nr:conserved hypothetical protein [Culex quinquefasciatus]|eukprot:XP_001843533.1 conserved hypothetical protein [Culex quinquefasciatus]
MVSTAENPMPELPPEVLVHIFRHLPVSDLGTARLTCLRWNAVVRDSAMLMKQFELIIGQRLLERFGKERGLLDQVLLFKSLGGVSFVRTTDNPLEVIGPFWDKFGATLQKVRFKECTLSAQTVLQVLRKTPNLKSFSLDESSSNTMAYHTPTWASFRLDRLEKLDLHVQDDRFLNLFGQLAPSLRVLKFDGKWKVRDQLFQTLLPLIRGRKDSLKKLTLRLIQTSPELLDEIGLIKGLQLTAISLQNWEIIDDRTLARFLRRQRNLEQFKCNHETYLEPSMLERLTDTQSKLRCVQIGTRNADLPRFFRNTRHLEHLKLSLGDSQIIDLSYNRSPKLKTLHLTGYNILKARLALFFQQSPNVQRLTLEYCRQPNITELVETIGELRSLEYLKLSNHSSKVGKLSADDSTQNHWPRLTTLYLRSCELAPGTIAALVHRAPNLSTVIVENVTLADADVLSITKNLPRLRLLTLTHPRNDLSETALGYLKKYGRGLKRLEFSIASGEITEKYRDREFAKALPGVEIEMVPRLPGEDGLDWYDDFDEF